jgi:hypothetical protein
MIKPKTIKTILTTFITIASLLLAFLGFLWAFCDPGLNYELYKFKIKTGYCYTGSVENPSSTWKHADKPKFKSNFENGKIDLFNIKPSHDSFVDKPVIEESRDTAFFSLDRLTRHESVGIAIFVNTTGVVKEDIRLSWGHRSEEEIIPKFPSETQQRIFKAGISAKERENALESDAGKVR